jgi:hypothetical protein
MSEQSDTPRTDANEFDAVVAQGEHSRMKVVPANEARQLERDLAAARAKLAKEELDTTAGKLIDAWVADKGEQIPWAKAVQIVAIVTKQSGADKDRLLRLGDEDGKCGMCGRDDADRDRLAAENAALKCELRDITLALNDERTHNTMTIAEVCAALKRDVERLRNIVNKQAEDEGLWFVAQTAPEAYLQQELRNLHAAIDAALALNEERK